jgi:cell division protein FtsZ
VESLGGDAAAPPAATGAARRGGRRLGAPAPAGSDRLADLGADTVRTDPRKARLQQGVLPLEAATKGRFERSEPNLCRGEDLDIPTYIRRGVALN